MIKILPSNVSIHKIFVWKITAISNMKQVMKENKNEETFEISYEIILK